MRYKKISLMTILETIGAFIFAMLCFGNEDNLKICIVWGIILIVWVACFEIAKRARNRKKGE